MDPLGQESSPYVYCGNDPISGVDPSGGYSYAINGVDVSEEMFQSQSEILANDISLERQHREYMRYQGFHDQMEWEWTPAGAEGALSSLAMPTGYAPAIQTLLTNATEIGIPLLVYQQSTGETWEVYPDGNACPLGIGYAGKGKGMNNPQMEGEPDIGPLPRGMWIVGSIGSHFGLKNSIVLTPTSETKRILNSYGRTGHFLYHGDFKWSTVLTGRASKGCPVTLLPTRLSISKSLAKILQVVR